MLKFLRSVKLVEVCGLLNLGVAVACFLGAIASPSESTLQISGLVALVTGLVLINLGD